MDAPQPHETWSADERRAAQAAHLAAGLPDVVAGNPFYRAKLAAAGIRDAREVTLDTWAGVPFTMKGELSADQAANPPYGSNLSYPLARYSRLHQTSGTTGKPLRILDTRESWRWWMECWADIYRAAGVGAGDRVFFCFSFGPFVGFWSAFDGAQHAGALVISGAALSTAERVHALLATDATVLVCTPTYALRLAEAAREEAVDLSRSSLRVSVHAGEPGASIPATRARIEEAFGVRAFDHTGATEVGATGFSCTARDGVHVIERGFLVEIRDPATGAVADEGDGELVLTNLGRWGSPAIRYRTGDRVQATRGRCACGRTLVKLAGGISGRIDDMVVVRGVNVFPSAIESVVRRFAEVAEFRIEAAERRGMVELTVTLEPLSGVSDAIGERVASEIHRDIGIRCAVALVEPGSLERFEMKARRFRRIE